MHAQGLKTQENIVNMSRAFVDGVKAAGLSEEEVEQIWLKVLSPVAAELFKGQMEDFRARVRLFKSVWNTLDRSQRLLFLHQ